MLIDRSPCAGVRCGLFADSAEVYPAFYAAGQNPLLRRAGCCRIQDAHSDLMWMASSSFPEAIGWKPSAARQKWWRREIESVRIGRSIQFRAEAAEKLIERGTMPALERQ